MQLYTVARQTAELAATAVDGRFLGAVAQRLRERISGLDCEVYDGAGDFTAA